MTSNRIAPGSMADLDTIGYYLSKELLDELIAGFIRFNQILNGRQPIDEEQKIDSQLISFSNLRRSNEDWQSAIYQIDNSTRVKLINSLVINKDMTVGMFQQHLNKVGPNRLKEYLIEQNCLTISFLKRLKVQETANENSSDGSSSGSANRPPETLDESGSGEVDDQNATGERTEEPTVEEPTGGEESTAGEQTDAENRAESNDEDLSDGREQLKRKAERDRPKKSRPPKKAKTGESPNKSRASRASPRFTVNKKYQKQVMEMMHEAGEVYLSSVLEAGNLLAAHDKRSTVSKKDLDLMKRLQR